MRLFEIMLIAVNIPFILWGFFSSNRPRQLNWLPILALLLAAIHLVAEGYRWQMVPAYLLTADLFLLALSALSGKTRESRKGVLFLGRVAGLILLSLAIALPLLLPVPKLPPPSGEYPVGTTIVYLKDESRAEIYTAKETDQRELMVQLWYPAMLTGEETESVYIPDLDVAATEIAAQLSISPFLFDHINLTNLDIFIDPAVAAGDPFPVIVFAHGLSGVRMQNTTMMRELASRGYIVIAADHTYANAISIFPDGRVTTYAAEQLFTNGRSNPQEANGLLKVWAEDFDFMLNKMAEWNTDRSSRFLDRIDLNHVGIFGHSTGGGAALEYCLRYERCDAGVALDSWVLPVSAEIDTEDLSQPFMFINTPSWLGENNSARGRLIFDGLRNDGYLLTLAQTAHYDFADIPLLSPLTPQLGLSGRINSAYSLQMQNEYLLAFFDTYLRGEIRPLLQQAPPYPELTMETNLAAISNQ